MLPIEYPSSQVWEFRPKRSIAWFPVRPLPFRSVHVRQSVRDIQPADRS